MPVRINNKQQIRARVFVGGQNSADDPAVLQPGFAQKIQNAIINKAGEVVQRGGTTRIGDNPDTLISRWSFNATSSIDDKASNNGSDVNVTYVDGKFGKAASFNGSDSRIIVSAASNIDVVSMGPCRFSAWIYPLSDGEGDTGRVFDKQATGGAQAWVSDESGGTVVLNFSVDYDSTDALVKTSTTINLEEWTKVDFVHNSDKSLDIYINGAIASYATDTTGVGSLVDDSAVDLGIGNNTGLTTTFDGYIDEFRVYDGSFTAAQLALDKVNGLTRYTVGSTIDRVYRIINTSLQRLDDDFKDWTDIDTGFTTDLATNFVQAKDLLFILNGTDNVHSMNSSETVTDEGNTNTDPPRTTVGEYMTNNRLFLGGSKTESERDFVWFSDTLDPQTFDRNANVIKVRSGGGGKITALKQFRQDELIIYKEDSVFILFTRGATPLTDWELDVVVDDIGCKAGKTVANLRNEQIFLDNNGDVRLLSRTEFDKYRNSVISDPIRDVLETINLDQIDKAAGYFHDSKYFLFFPTGTSTENDTGVIWDAVAAKKAGTQSAGWTVISQNAMYPSCFTEMEFSDNKIALLFGDNRDISLVHRLLDGKTDDGFPIEMVFRGPLHTVDFVRDAVFGPAHLVADSSDSTSITVRGSLNATTYTDVGEMTVDSAEGVDLPVNLPVNFSGGAGKSTKFIHTKQLGRAKSFSLEVEHSEYNKSVTLNEYSLFAKQIG